MKWLICTSSCMLQALVLISNWNYHLKKSQRLFRQRNDDASFLAVCAKATFHLRPSTHDAFFISVCAFLEFAEAKKESRRKLFLPVITLSYAVTRPSIFKRFSRILMIFKRFDLYKNLIITWFGFIWKYWNSRRRVEIHYLKIDANLKICRNISALRTRSVGFTLLWMKSQVWRTTKTTLLFAPFFRKKAGNITGLHILFEYVSLLQKTIHFFFIS